MSLAVGIVGLPNVGKSTLFNALLSKQAALAANYPFATIEPNVGIVPVPDPRLNKLAAVIQNYSGKNPPMVPATVKFIDIAGLVAGAHKGEGLGNQFLASIREVDLICHVVRFFADDSIHHVTGKVQPQDDKEIVESELILADLQTLEKQKEPRGVVSKEEKLHWEVVQKLTALLNQAKLASGGVWNTEELEVIKQLNLLTIKPMLIVANVSEDSLSNKSIYKDLLSLLGNDVTPVKVVAISAKIEEELSQLSAEEQLEYLKDLELSSSGLERLITAAYNLLGLHSFLTAGEKEVRAWKIRKGASALEAAGEIHTDFMKKFIKAEVVSYHTFMELGGWKNCFEVGKVRLEGREYVVQDGDVITFKIGA